jgi:hypothetical protein
MNRSSARPSRLLVAALAVSQWACSSAITPTQRIETTYIPGASGAMTIAPDNGSIVAVVAAPLDVVWRRLPVAFDSVAVPLSLIDPKGHLIGNEGFKVRAKLGKERLSTYLECGTTQVGPNADSYEVHLTVMVKAEASGADRTKVTVNVTAAAKPLQFSQDYSRCSSKTALERKLLDVIAAPAKP